MLDACLELYELNIFELQFAFEGLADENVWKRPAPELLSVGELAGHIAHWFAVRLSDQCGTYPPDLTKLPVSSPRLQLATGCRGWLTIAASIHRVTRL